MADFWKERYDMIIDYLAYSQGAGWVLGMVEAAKEYNMVKISNLSTSKMAHQLPPDKCKAKGKVESQSR